VEDFADGPAVGVASGGMAYSGAFTGAGERPFSGTPGVQIWGESGTYWWVQFDAGVLQDGSAFQRAFIPKSAVRIPADRVSVDSSVLSVEVGGQVSLGWSVGRPYADDVNVSMGSSNDWAVQVADLGGDPAGPGEGSAALAGVGEGVAQITLASTSSYGAVAQASSIVTGYTPFGNVNGTAQTGTPVLAWADGGATALYQVAAGESVVLAGVSGSFWAVPVEGGMGYVSKDAVQIDMSVTLSQSNVVLAKGASAQLSAAVSPDGGSLAWSSSDGGIAAVDNGTISGVGEGVADVQASVSWPYWGPASKSAKVSVYDPIKQTPGLVLSDTALLYWADANAESEQLDKGVQVSVIGRLGDWWVVDSAGVPGFVAKADVKLLTKVDLSAEYLVFQVGDNTTLTVDAAPDPDAIEWSSSASGVLVVAAGGKATAKGEGVTVVSATGSWSFTDPATGTATASVYTPIEKVGAVAKQAMSVRAAADGTSRVDDGVAEGDTMAVLGKAGDYLYVEHDGARGFVPKQSSEVDADIVITDADLVLAVGQTQPLGVKITPAGTDPAVWTSTDPSIVSVDQNGTLTGNKVGDVVVSVEGQPAVGARQRFEFKVSVFQTVPRMIARVMSDASARKNADGTSDEVCRLVRGSDVEVIGQEGDYWVVSCGERRGLVPGRALQILADKVDLSPQWEALAVGAKLDVKPTVTPEAVGVAALEWSSSNSDVGYFSRAGTLVGGSQGVVTVSASALAVNGKVSGWTSVTVYEPISETTVGYTTTAGAARMGATDGSPVAANLSQGDQVRVLGVSGNWWWCRLPGGWTGFVPKGWVAIPVTSVTVSPSSATVVAAGDPVQLTATLAPALATDKTVTWTSSTSVFATVDATGKVTGVKAGSAVVSATAGGVVGKASVTVASPPPSADSAAAARKPSIAVTSRGLSLYGFAVSLPAGACGFVVDRLGPGSESKPRAAAWAAVGAGQACGEQSRSAYIAIDKAWWGQEVTWRLRWYADTGLTIPGDKSVSKGKWPKATTVIGQTVVDVEDVTSTSAVLSWARVNGQKANGVVDNGNAGYGVFSVGKDGAKKRLSTLAGAGATSLTVAGLAPDTAYKYVVAVCTDRACTHYVGHKPAGATSKKRTYSDPAKFTTLTKDQQTKNNTLVVLQSMLNRNNGKTHVLLEGSASVFGGVPWVDTATGKEVSADSPWIDANGKEVSYAAPWLKLRWKNRADGKLGLLQLHVFVRFINKGGGGQQGTYDGVTVTSRSFAKNKKLVMSGIESYWSGQEITGILAVANEGGSEKTKGVYNDFGTNDLKFKTQVVWHDWDDRKDDGGKAHDANQRYLRVYMGVEGFGCGSDHWYEAGWGKFWNADWDSSSGDFDFICMPFEHQAWTGAIHSQQTVPESAYAATAAHEFGHTLGLRDAYWNDDVGDRMVENKETTVDKDRKDAIMKNEYCVDRIASNDLEMVLYQYAQRSQGLITDERQAYNNLPDDNISDKIGYRFDGYGKGSC
jgi:uncharacterized protein YjdB